MRPYASALSVRRLFRILVVLSVLFAPSVAAAAGHGMGVAGDGTVMTEMGHCQAPPSGQAEHDKKGGSCCISMCTAVAVAPTTPNLEKHACGEHANFFVPAEHKAYLGEIATPPPRFA